MNLDSRIEVATSRMVWFGVIPILIPCISRTSKIALVSTKIEPHENGSASSFKLDRRVPYGHGSKARYPQ